MRYTALILLALTLAALETPAQARQGERCFAETGYCITGRIHQFWEQNGGLVAFGYPIGPLEEELIEGRPVMAQWFERNRLELHPENARPYDVLLGRLGAEFVASQIQPAPEAPRDGCRFFAETGFNVCGEILGRWRAVGLELDGRRGLSEPENLALLGLPLTGQYAMRLADGNEYLVQWFERARLELHPENPPPHRVLLGLLGKETLDARPKPVPLPEYWLDRVNYYRAAAGVPPVREEAALNDNCAQHARYMAENEDLTHDQNPALPWSSAAGQICAQKGNAWMGGGGSWHAGQSIDGWMSSTGHRLWLIYPTTPVVGFGFYTNGRVTGAALDILSRAQLDTDSRYEGWPIRYPATGQISVPTSRYPITLQWPYFGDAPALRTTSLSTAAGVPVAHTATTDLPVGHKGILLMPMTPLPRNTVFVVRVEGSYDERPFMLSWSFSTGHTPIQ